MLITGFGGIAGAISRYLLGKWITEKSAAAFPFGTWIINLTGSFLLGFLFILHANGRISDGAWLLFGTGFLGAYTTFSTFGYETIQMLEKQQKKSAAIYVSTTVLLGILFAWIGAGTAGVLD